MSDSVTIFAIGGKDYNVIKTGIEQARQVSGISRTLSKYAGKAIKNLSDSENDNAGTLDIALAILGEVTEASLIEMFVTVFGCTTDTAKEHFDLALLVDGVLSIYNNQPTITRLVDRFFSKRQSTDSVADNSTPSE